MDPGNAMPKKKKSLKGKNIKIPAAIENNTEDGVDYDESDKADIAPSDLKVYIPGMALEEGEELEVDPSTYIMLHSLTTEWPCLSFDILRHGNHSAEDLRYPQTAWVVAGTQAENGPDNRIYLMRWTGLTRTGGFTEEEEAEMAENEEEPEECRGEPVMETLEIRHHGGCNRVRTLQCNQQTLIASWSDSGKVYVWDATSAYQEFSPGSSNIRPAFTISGHSTEGFSLSWSPFSNTLLSGDCAGTILQTSQSAQSNKFTGHSASVEDIQWSPTEPNVFASCSVDQTVRIWDARSGSTISNWKLHECDVNVMSWNKSMSFLLATGADDGSMRVWDMRMLADSACAPVASFSWHRSAVTSLEWHPTDSSVIAASGADNQLTLWDLAVERDTEQFVQDGGRMGDEINGIPPQLLFIHQGQVDMKEMHWHPQLPGTIISTAADSFNIFRTISV